MTKRGAITVIGLYSLAGFFVGLAIGRNMREELPQRTQTSFKDGKFTLVTDVQGSFVDAVKGVF